MYRSILTEYKSKMKENEDEEEEEEEEKELYEKHETSYRFITVILKICVIYQ